MCLNHSHSSLTAPHRRGSTPICRSPFLQWQTKRISCTCLPWISPQMLPSVPSHASMRSLSAKVDDDRWISARCLVSFSSHQQNTSWSQFATASKSRSSNSPNISSCQSQPLPDIRCLQVLISIPRFHTPFEPRNRCTVHYLLHCITSDQKHNVDWFPIGNLPLD